MKKIEPKTAELFLSHGTVTHLPEPHGGRADLPVTWQEAGLKTTTFILQSWNLEENRYFELGTGGHRMPTVLLSAAVMCKARRFTIG